MKLYHIFLFIIYEIKSFYTLLKNNFMFLFRHNFFEFILFVLNKKISFSKDNFFKEYLETNYNFWRKKNIDTKYYNSNNDKSIEHGFGLQFSVFRTVFTFCNL